MQNTPDDYEFKYVMKQQVLSFSVRIPQVKNKEN
jgi:hypothetical protein